MNPLAFWLLIFILLGAAPGMLFGVWWVGAIGGVLGMLAAVGIFVWIMSHADIG
jgi:hypothetical protein